MTSECLRPARRRRHHYAAIARTTIATVALVAQVLSKVVLIWWCVTLPLRPSREGLLCWTNLTRSSRVIAQNLVHRFERSRLSGIQHLFSLETVVQLLSLLMFATLLAECVHQTGVFGLQLVSVNLQICAQG